MYNASAMAKFSKRQSPVRNLRPRNRCANRIASHSGHDKRQVSWWLCDRNRLCACEIYARGLPLYWSFCYRSRVRIYRVSHGRGCGSDSYCRYTPARLCVAGASCKRRQVGINRSVRKTEQLSEIHGDFHTIGTHWPTVGDDRTTLFFAALALIRPNDFLDLTKLTLGAFIGSFVQRQVERRADQKEPLDPLDEAVTPSSAR